MTQNDGHLNAVEELRSRLTGGQAAIYLGLSVSTLNKMRMEGRGPRYLRIGRRVFYRRQDLDTYLERSVVETADSRAA